MLVLPQTRRVQFQLYIQVFTVLCIFVGSLLGLVYFVILHIKHKRLSPKH